MIESAFYIVVFCWMVTMTVWQFREKQNAAERMEMLKLFRSQTLTEYTSQAKPSPRPQNFIQNSIGKAYEHLLGDDD